MNKDIKILLVDDEPDFTETLSFWLKSKGYSVVLALNGSSAIEMIKENPPDIIFLDLNMPVMDGVQTLKKIREFNKNLPIIMVSSHVEDPRMAQASTYGTSGVFYKDKDFTEVMSLLEIALRRHIKLK